MKTLARCSLLLALVAGCSILSYAQGFRVESKSPPAPTGTETFISLDGRFTVSLPQQVSGYRPQSADTPDGRIEGVLYDWRTAGGVFMAGYVETPQVLEKVSKAALDQIRVSILSESKGKATLNSETDISIEGHPGRELKIAFPDSFAVARIYVVRNRVYQIIAALPTAKKDQESAVVKILDSFKILTQADIEATIRKQTEAATPRSLPQETIAQRPKSDAEDEGLKGKVKTVVTETEDLSGSWAVGKRKSSATDYYNEKGNLTKQESYDYRGNLDGITVYGYIDGDRASHRKYIEHEYNPPPAMIATAPGQPKPKYDPRYSNKFKFKYDDKGNLTEKIWYSNDGSLWLRYVYNFKENKKEELVYSKDGSLNQKYLYTLDDKGNEMEETVFETKDDSVRSKYSYTYEFDPKGNWTKRTTSKLVTKDGKSSFAPYSMTYRIIVYH